MGIFSRAKEKGELMLVFNIGSSFVGATFFLTEKSGVPKIIFSIEEPIRIEERIDVDRFFFLTMKSLEIVVNKIYKAHIGVPFKIFCVLSSPWYVSQIRTITLEKNTPFIFNTKLADSLIQKEVNLFKDENFIKKTDFDSASRIIELKNIRTVLNGYNISKPLNKKIKQLEMNIFISMSGEQILKSIEDAIGKHMHFKSIEYSSFAMASFTVIRDIYSKKENFLFIDIGGEVTDIFMVKKNTLCDSITFPLGRNFFIRGISSSLGCTLSEASSLISLLKDGHEEDSENEKLMLAMDKLKAKWLKQLEESLTNLSNDISIPSTIYVTTDKNLADFFCKIIKNEEYNQYSFTESKFDVIYLGTQELHDFVTFKDSIFREPSLIINSIYINRFLIYPVNAPRK